MQKNTPKEITTSVENSIPADQRDSLRNLRNTLQSRHNANLAAMKMVAKTTA